MYSLQIRAYLKEIPNIYVYIMLKWDKKKLIEGFNYGCCIRFKVAYHNQSFGEGNKVAYHNQSFGKGNKVTDHKQSFGEGNNVAYHKQSFGEGIKVPYH